ncbi:UDP-N-acetylglucosamine 1-carboxyvinyltransferase [Pelagicoccus sp. SDUM812003]|uniref:UDP-N-acetylglucosamine 1-carboxyvinyltransferase n=1 Tax=Pelagicoccus sp. SDUM812003 TaxID=3041267 RepID=UPI00281086C2|nr:UDP-N-acetylglucosamine 1-carboxyvinyltransferase [Pelagicoccus sp. SDUM812003]MDQ8205539.1 UDP-N-acetylglucosamine 1-carboxyvinyltransferase [Pelagicoccus sp. SDUM812003]
MANLIVHGGKPLSGTITPSGNKNAVLPILCATLLTDEAVTLSNVPAITDIEKLVSFFRSIGSRIDWDREAKTMRLDHSELETDFDTASLPQGMRSAVLLFAPLLHRFKKIALDSNPKGCALGIRELDPHLEILACLGATIEHNGELKLTIEERFTGASHWADYMSVTTTETFVMAAALADGVSTLTNAASEPHVQDLCRFLISMGASIEGVGTSVLTVTGAEALQGADAAISSDHHEVATFLALGAITGGEVQVLDSTPQHFDLINRSFDKLGVTIAYDGNTAICRSSQELRIQQPFTPNLLPKIEAAPWPYFPVDLLPPMVALATRSEGVMHFWNKVYEGGFSWLPELVKFGAHAVVSDPHRIIIFGQRPMRPAVVEAPYIIRAAVALYMTAASIEGRSIVKNADPIRRAHPNFAENLRKLGAEIEWDE